MQTAIPLTNNATSVVDIAISRPPFLGKYYFRKGKVSTASANSMKVRLRIPALPSAYLYEADLPPNQRLS
jgi:hypothetical protein